MFDKYYNKYLKYKNKYLLLKKLKNELFQKGGNKPLFNDLKNINIFVDEYSKFREYFDPTLGFIFMIYGYKNYYDSNLLDGINNIFHKLDTGEIIITKKLKLFMLEKGSMETLGKIIGFLFIINQFNINNYIPFEIISDKKEFIKVLLNLINSKFDKKGLKIMIEPMENDRLKKVLMVLLAVVYLHAGINHTGESKEGFKNYYRGLYNGIKISVELFSSQIRRFQIDDLNYLIRHLERLNESGFAIIDGRYDENELNVNLILERRVKITDFNQLLILNYLRYIGSHIPLLQQTQATIIKNDRKLVFPDCGETSLRNFIRIILLEGGVYNMDILDRLGATRNIKEYFRIYEEQDHISEIKKEYRGQLLSSRDAWALLVSNIEDVSYVGDVNSFKLELNAGLCLDGTKQNMLLLINKLFDNINEWNDFNRLIGINLQTKLNEIGTGEIIFIKEGYNYKWTFYDRHYDIESFIINKNDNDFEFDFILSDFDKLLLSIIKDIQLDDLGLENIFLYRYNINTILILNINSELLKESYFKKKLKEYFNSFEELILDDNVKISISNIIFPNLKILKTSDNFLNDNKPLILNLPKLVELNLGSNFNQPLELNLPELTLLDLDLPFFNKPFKLNLPKLTLLDLDRFNHYINRGDLPPNLTHLTLYEFDQVIGVGILPQSLTHLTLDSFTQVIGDNVLPTNLTHLTLGNSFNQVIEDGVLPANLTHLTLGNSFNQVIGVNVLPVNLTHLTLGNSFNQVIGVNVLPANLTHLTLIGFDQVIRAGILPQSLTHLTLTSFDKVIGVNVLPQSLTHLTLYSFNKVIGDGILPQSLTHLTLGKWFNQVIEGSVLPNSLSHLTFGDKINKASEFNQVIKAGVLPNSLTHLTFGIRFNQVIGVGVLPPNLIYLDVGNNFNQPIKNVLPNSLKQLIFGYYFNQEIKYPILPEFLKELTLGYYFNQKIKLDDIPNLTRINIDNEYRYIDDLYNLPETIMIYRYNNKDYEDRETDDEYI